MTSDSGLGQDTGKSEALLSDRVRGALVVATGAAMMMGLAVAAMAMLTSQDSWVMKATNQAMQNQQQAIAANYIVSIDE